MRIETLILSPHADDEVLGAFAFLSQKAFVIYFGVEERPDIPKAKRLDEIKEVSKYAGFQYRILDHEVNRYDSNQLISPIEDIIQEFQPQRILVPEQSYNQDHRAVHTAAITALRPHDKLYFVPEVILYEQLHSAIWQVDGKFIPNLFLSIDIDQKIKIYKLHSSQVREHRSEERVKHLAGLRGAMCNCNYAEAYFLRRMLGKGV
jgi:LmbE family N-acetylglucosaminyl deacetylase